MTPDIEILKYFKYDHLPEKLQAVSKPFGMLAESLAKSSVINEELLMALRKLLEAKDCAVRAVL